MGSLRYLALVTAGAALLLAAPLVATAAAPKPAKLSITVTSLKLLDNDTRKVTFKATSNQSFKSYSWSFGDPSAKAQNRSASPHPGHIFAAHKTYTVTLIATTRAGGHASAIFKLKL
jgi:PKD repeat protein